jgi:tripartite-type tricarboxylate transporter receptor subunit TctC
MPANSVERLNRELNKILAQPASQARFAELGAEVLPLKPAEYKALVQGETRLFTEIVKSRGITAE